MEQPQHGDGISWGSASLPDASMVPWGEVVGKIQQRKARTVPKAGTVPGCLQAAITILTLGFFLLVVNAAMGALVAGLLPGFHIPGGFWSAFATALIVWITGWVGSSLIGPRGKIDVYVRKP